MSELDKYKVDLTSTNDDKDEFVSCIILDKNGRPLRLKRSNEQKLDAGKYDLCSGHMHNGEVPLHALIRELTEEMEVGVNDVIEIFRLGRIQTPHPKLNHTITHMYCMITKLGIQEINMKIQHARHKEIVEAEFLDSINSLEKQISDSNSNWRVIMTDEVRQKLNVVRNIRDRENYLEK